MDPFTAAIIGSTALQATGSIMQGNSQASAYRQQASASERNAESADIQARQAYDAGLQNELAQRRSSGRQQADVRASVAESGFDSGGGTALLVQQQAARDLELDALTTRYETLLQGGAYEQQALNDRYTAQSLRESAGNARGRAMLALPLVSFPVPPRMVWGLRPEAPAAPGLPRPGRLPAAAWDCVWATPHSIGGDHGNPYSYS